MLKNNSDNLVKVKYLVTEYRDIFTSPEVAMGKTNLMEFKINLEPDAVPKKAKVRPLNPKQIISLKEQIELWKKGDVIEESDSPWPVH